jgi:predicted enzyme related to lactoylglutathione lyase
LDVAIPKPREGSYFPDWLLTPRRRVEQALVSVVGTCYFLGVSTRRVERLVETLGIARLSKSQVSAMARSLDEQDTAFRNRPLAAGPYTYVWIDALTQRVRDGGWIVIGGCLVLVPFLRAGTSSGQTFRHDAGMPSRIAVLAIDAVQPRVVADFWCAVLGWQVVEEDAGGVSIAPSDGAWPTIDVMPVPERKGAKNRLHLDLRADGVTTSQELDRLLALGASRVDVGQGPDVSWVVLGDPEGNEFCLLSRSVQEL